MKTDMKKAPPTTTTTESSRVPSLRGIWDRLAGRLLTFWVFRW